MRSPTCGRNKIKILIIWVPSVAPWYPVTALTRYSTPPQYLVTTLTVYLSVSSNPSYWLAPCTQSPLLLGSPLYPVTTLTGYPQYLVTSLTWHPFGKPSHLVPGTGYDVVVYRYTYLEWVYQVPITHVGNGAGLWCVVYKHWSRGAPTLYDNGIKASTGYIKKISLKYTFISLILRLLQKGENEGGNSQYSYSICALLGRRGNKSVQWNRIRWF